VLTTAACSGSSGSKAESSDTTHAAAQNIDYKALGLWDDGPCDKAEKPLVLGTMAPFETPVLSLEEQAIALQAAAKAFNERGGANGACIEVHTCDEGADPNKAQNCVRELDKAGIVATVNDLPTVALAEVADAFEKAGIPRVAGNAVPEDWAKPNMYTLDAGSTGSALMFPQSLLEQGIKDQGMVRVDVPATAALAGFFDAVYGDDGVKVRFDAPVPGGTTDYGQFILGAQQKNAKGLNLLLGEQEAVQVVRAGKQLGTDLLMATTPGTFSHQNMKDLGDFTKQMVLLWSYPPATFDLPAYEALRADLAASGEESLQPENLRANPMKSWIGLYALLRVLRDTKTTEFTRESVTDALDKAKDVPLLGIFGDETWTPNRNHPGAFKRAGTNHWATYKWDPDAKTGGFDGNFVQTADINFDKVLCGSPLGGPGPC
jgi:ABC-type branched-subunit amino acid transport system substrate-binding protein